MSENYSRDVKLQELGYSLAIESTPGANYLPAVQVGGLLFTAGCVPFVQGNELKWPGKIPNEVPLEIARQAAALAAANTLRAAYNLLGTLDRIKRVVRVCGYVNSSAGFTQQPLIVNSASELYIAVFGELGRHARTAIGVAELPLNACVEIEALFECAEV
ncbi:MAG: hypothetical protein C5B53_06755 [Candidatus Melainabacteria bacterium]|nr:MAG: hypothetical protein C5B53_06755 [Candidatus Melainabacteria bacterium]